METTDRIEAIWRAYKAKRIDDKELVSLQTECAPRCSFDNNPAVGRDGPIFLCLQCGLARLPQINARYQNTTALVGCTEQVTTNDA